LNISLVRSWQAVILCGIFIPYLVSASQYMAPEFAPEGTHSKCLGVFNHFPTPNKNPSILPQFP
ncbi:hypothetical protein Q2378_25835, partial [Escherichia coli]|nr:hypothetical protein [Escherichia coli]